MHKSYRVGGGRQIYKCWMVQPKERVHLGNQSADGVNIEMYIIEYDGRV